MAVCVTIFTYAQIGKLHLNLLRNLKNIGDLFSSANRDGGFPYHLNGDSMGEPSLMVSLAALALRTPPPGFDRLIEWVLSLRNADGSVGLQPGSGPLGNWLTPHFLIVMHHLRREKEKNSALDFILNFRSITFASAVETELDPTLVGWPWISDTFGWVEPTSWALLALRLAGQTSHPRYIEGQKLLKNRSIPQGGWNYGNKIVYNNVLIPFCDTTSLALLALDDPDAAFFNPHLEYLEKEAGSAESLYSLVWAAICLEKFGKPVDILHGKILGILDRMPIETLNIAHAALALIALSGNRILTP